MKEKCLQILLSLMVVTAVAGFAPPSIAVAGEDQFDTIVYPTGLYPQDMQNVQAAVDQGGTILLKATDTNGIAAPFNFGVPFEDSGSVILTKDVVILGETAGSDMTTIFGGEPAFYGDTLLPVKSKIHSIHFDRPGFAALYLQGSSGSEFSSNWVTDVIGYPDYVPGISRGHAVGVQVGSLPIEQISGKLIITNNVIDGVHADLAYGLYLFIFGAEAYIEGNEIRGTRDGGMTIAFNAQPVWIEGNLVVPGPTNDPTAFGNGIEAWYPFALSGRYYIRDNIVECENPLADGIYLFGESEFFPVENAVIEGNRVVMHNSFGGIALYGAVRNSHVGQNRIEGSSLFALHANIGRFPEDTATTNTFVGNNIALFQSYVADVFLNWNSQDNVMTGLSGTVIDLGVGNRITGYTKIGLSEPIGQQIRDALAVKRAIWESYQSYPPLDLSK